VPLPPLLPLVLEKPQAAPRRVRHPGQRAHLLHRPRPCQRLNISLSPNSRYFVLTRSIRGLSNIDVGYRRKAIATPGSEMGKFRVSSPDPVQLITVDAMAGDGDGKDANRVVVSSVPRVLPPRYRRASSSTAACMGAHSIAIDTTRSTLPLTTTRRARIVTSRE